MTTTSRTVSAITTLVGALLLAALAVAAIIPVGRAVAMGNSDPRSLYTASASGITHVEVESNAARIDVGFGDVAEVELKSSAPSHNSWRLTTSGNTLKASNSSPMGGFCFVWCGNREEHVTLTLPRELAGELSAQVELLSGRMELGGDFSNVGIEVAAGDFAYTGATPSLDVEVGAGTVGVNVTGAREANFTIAAGQLEATLEGRAPERISAEVFAGEFDLTVPDVTYQVNTDVAFGNLDNRLNTSPTSAHVVELEIAAGKATLRPAG